MTQIIFSVTRTSPAGFGVADPGEKPAAPRELADICVPRHAVASRSRRIPAIRDAHPRALHPTAFCVGGIWGSGCRVIGIALCMN